MIGSSDNSGGVSHVHRYGGRGWGRGWGWVANG